MRRGVGEGSKGERKKDRKMCRGEEEGEGGRPQGGEGSDQGWNWFSCAHSGREVAGGPALWGLLREVSLALAATGSRIASYLGGPVLL